MNLFQHLLQSDRIFIGITNRAPYMMVQPMRVIPVIIATPTNWAANLSGPLCMTAEPKIYTQLMSTQHTKTYQDGKPQLAVADTLESGMQEAVSIFSLDKDANCQHAPKPTVHIWDEQVPLTQTCCERSGGYGLTNIHEREPLEPCLQSQTCTPANNQSGRLSHLWLHSVHELFSHPHESIQH